MDRKIGLAAFLIFGTISFIEAGQTLSENEPCWTPNQESGKCINLRQCSELMNFLTRSSQNPANLMYLRESQCGFVGRDPLVCCAIRDNVNSDGNGNNNSTNNHSHMGHQIGSHVGQGMVDTDRPTGHTHQPQSTGYAGNVDRILPDDCGQDLSNRIVGGEVTDLEEFPWMALLEYQKPNGKTTACGGALISLRYVLTAAHCLAGKALPKNWQLKAVRLGEYNTSTDRDCVPDGDNSMRCADDPVSVGIEEQIVHESYKPDSLDQHSDIALIRLSHDVRFTDFIKPVCLPRDDQINQKLQVAGWGKTASRSESEVKLKVSLPLVDPAKCFATYKAAGVGLGSTQLCAGGEKGKDSCRGDSGGPLMQVERLPDGKQRWSEVGVVSFGPTPCGMLGWPGVYTKVYDYLPWIYEKIRP